MKDFDEKLAQALKRRGMSLAEENNSDALEFARAVAESLPNAATGITADHVGRALKRLGKKNCLGPAAGSLFKEKKWRFTGTWIASVRTKNHGRMLREWQLTGGPDLVPPVSSYSPADYRRASQGE